MFARDNWLNRLINLAVINLAGVPSIVHALFGLGDFVYAARFGYSIISASLTLAIMTLPVTEVGLWADLKDRLNGKATALQLEQQQKLCIAPGTGNL